MELNNIIRRHWAKQNLQGLFIAYLIPLVFWLQNPDLADLFFLIFIILGVFIVGLIYGSSMGKENVKWKSAKKESEFWSDLDRFW